MQESEGKESSSVVVMEGKLNEGFADMEMKPPDEMQTSEDPQEKKRRGLNAVAAMVDSAPHFRKGGLCSPERRGLLMCVTSMLLFHAYLAYAIFYHIDRETGWLWCDGLGFVVLCTAIVYVCFILSYGISWLLRQNGFVAWMEPKHERCLKQLDKTWVQLALYALLFMAVLIFLIVDTKNSRERLISALGMVVLVALGAILSKAPMKIRWRQVTWGLALQFLFALLILRWPLGRNVIDCLGSKINSFLAFTDEGSSFTFGYLVHRRPFIPALLANDSVAFEVATDINAAQAVPGIVVFKALSVIYFFSFIVNIMFYYGVVQKLTMWIGWFLRITIGTTACESLNAASNIFLGQAMAPLLIQPYLADMTLSEIHCVMTSGFATIAGTVMAAYISFGVPPGHLLSASVMSAPAALAFGKLFWPETEVSVTKDTDIKLTKAGDKEDANLIDAATRGAADAAQLVLNITAIVIAFIAFISFLNAIFSFFGGLVGAEFVTFEWLLGKVFMPLAWLMGVPWSECESVGYLIGIKTVVNEFIAYRELGILIANDALSPRSIAIATYALCGFANPGSMGVQLAILGSLCPERKRDFARVIMRAFVAGSAACFLTACIAGALYTEDYGLPS